MSRVNFVSASLWASQPPGIAIVSTHEHVTVESGGRILLGAKMHRQNPLVLVDEAFILVGGQEQRMTPHGARTWAESATLMVSEGELGIGPVLAQAWDDHVARWRRARFGAAPALVAPGEDGDPLGRALSGAGE